MFRRERNVTDCPGGGGEGKTKIICPAVPASCACAYEREVPLQAWWPPASLGWKGLMWEPLKEPEPDEKAFQA